MKVSSKLWSGYGLLLLLMGSLLLYHIRIIGDLAEAQQRLVNVSVRVSVSSAEQLNRLDALWDAGQKFNVLGDSAYAALYARLAADIDNGLAVLDSVSAGAPEAERVAALMRVWQRLVPRDPAGNLVIPSPDRLTATRDTLKSVVIDVSGAARSSMLAEADRAQRDLARARRSAWVVGVAALVAGLTLGLLIVRSISGSLARLSLATREVASGRLSHRLVGTHDAEFRELADNFNSMVDRLAEVDQLKRNFISGISHDLKSPLASIKEAILVLLEGIPGPLSERQERLLRLALASVERLSSMIADLLTLAQLESQAIGYSFEPTDLRAAVQSVSDRLEPRFQRARVPLRITAPEPAVVHCDSDRIDQVIENLLDNALKFSPEEKPIDVEVMADGKSGGAIIRVIDRGRGIANEDKAAVFERFAQAGASGGSTGGVGLGLTICREIVTSHGGQISVEDTPGGGSTFVVNLPDVPPDA